MKKVILTIGPQHSGKSTFLEKIISESPHFKLISRDAILIEMFGTVWLSSYSGGHYAAWDKLWEMVEEQCQANEFTILLDAWNGGAHERRKIIEKLRALGVTFIEGWYFITPFEMCFQWYLALDPIVASNEMWRERKLKMRKSSYKMVYDNFHSQDIENEPGFNLIQKINPLEIRTQTFVTVAV